MTSPREGSTLDHPHISPGRNRHDTLLPGLSCMYFRILGPLEASRNDVPVNLGGPRQHTVLAMLLLEAGQVVPVNRLIDAVWDDDPPSTAREQIHICISSLRRAIGMVGGAGLIATRSPGYLLHLDGCALDARIFDGRVQQGRKALSAADPAAAITSLRSALSLWRGEALSSVTSALVQRSVTHLNERRLSIHEECIEIELKAGLAQDPISELMALTRENPLRERLSALLMTALYRTGRQADALATYRNTRTVLMEELGIEPSLNLQQLHQMVLAGKPIAAPAGTVGREPVRRAPDGRMAPASAQRPPRVIPALLPAAIPDFTGRSALIDRVTAKIGAADTDGQAPPMIVFYGPGGVGKTTVGIHIAHRLATKFPDGQLFAHLHSGSRPLGASDVLGRFLRVLGVSGSSLPENGDERAEVYRNLLAKRRMLIVLDNAMSEEQISQLLPGTAQCSVLVTSRRRLAGLSATDRIEIGPLSQRSAVAMLSRIVGAERIKAEPKAVAALCELCGRLPLVLRIAAARLVARPHWSVAALVDRLADESRRLDELNYGEMGLRASIALSYDALSPEARRLFRLLALCEAPSFASWVGSPLIETNPLHAEDLFEELAEAHLLNVEPVAPLEPVRYRFHDIVHPFARERLLELESPHARRAALKRLIGALLYLVSEAYRRQYSGDHMLLAGSASLWEFPTSYTNRLLDNPLSWYEQERLSIIAGVNQAAAAGLVEHAWSLASSAVPLFESHSHFSDWHATHESALKTACGSDDQRGEAVMRYSLGSLYMIERESSVAARQFEQASRIFEELGDKYGAALVLRYVAFLDRQSGNLELALSRWEAALGTFQVVGDSIAEAYVLHNIAQIRLDYGEAEMASRLLARAERICSETGNLRVGAQVQHRRAALHLLCGEFDLASQTYAKVLQVVRESGDRIGECLALIGLATADVRRGEPLPAHEILTKASELTATAGDPVVSSLAALAFAEAGLAADRLETAAGYADQAAHDFQKLGAGLLRAQAVAVRGRIHRAAGSPDRAMEAWRIAMGLLAGLKLGRRITLCEELEALMSDTQQGSNPAGRYAGGGNEPWALA